MRLPTSFDVLRERNVARFAAATGISALGSGMADIALAFAILDLGGPTELGVVFLARELPLVLLVLLGGVWADRISRRTILVGADAVRAAAQATLAALLFSGSADLWKIILLQIAFGGANAFSRPAYTGLIPELVSPGALQRANALLGLARSPARIAGPALGALLVAAASPAWAIAVDSTTFALSAALVLSLRLADRSRVAATSVVRDLRDGWREFTSRTWVWTVVSYFGLYQLTLFPALLVLGPYVAKQDLGGAGAWGTILAVEAAGSLVGGVVALRLQFSRPLLADTLLALPMAAILLLLAVPAPVVVLAATGFVAALCLTLGDAVWFATLQRHIPEHAISRISSFDWLGSVALNPVGYVLVGPLSDVLGVSTTLVLAGALNIASAAGVMLIPSVRNLPAYPVVAHATSAGSRSSEPGETR